MSQLGVGVMIGMLSGNKETVDTIKNSLGKKIQSVALEDNKLKIAFKDGTKIALFDDGQSCCESRYMSTDDDLSHFKNTVLREISLRNAPPEPNEYDAHEVQFLIIDTGKGRITMANHNIHNGYYGGFFLICKPDL